MAESTGRGLHSLNTLLLNGEKNQQLGACQIYGYIDIHTDMKCLEVSLLPDT